MTIFKQVKDDFDWDSYLTEHYTIKRTAQDEELRICCPNCLETKFKCYVNTQKGVFICFKCPFNSKKFDLFDFVAVTEDITRGQAVSLLLRLHGPVIPDNIDVVNLFLQKAPLPRTTEIKTIQMPEDCVLLTGADNIFWGYLIGRGLTPQEILAVKFWFSTRSNHKVVDSNGKIRGDLANRVIVPIYGGQNKLVSWQARTVIDAELRYLTAPESSLSKTLWPYVKPHATEAVLVEGVFDCLAMRRVTELNSYATFSKKISLEQIQLLKSWGITDIVLFWDKRDAKKDMIKSIEDLRIHFKHVYVSGMKGWPSSLDPGAMLSRPDGQERIREAIADRINIDDELEFTKWQIEF